MSEADRLKRLRAKTTSPAGEGHYAGDRPIRIRGIHRAAKRGEEWAISSIKLMRSNPMAWLLQRYYGPIAHVMNFDSPFLRLIPKHEGWTGKYIEIPVKFEPKKS